MARKLAKKQPTTFRFEELEQRILFSADIAPGLDTAAVDEQVLAEEQNADDRTDTTAAADAVDQNSTAARWELVFVNENVTDYEKLVADLQQGDEERVFEVVVLESDRDGIGQVTEFLAERSELTAVHFITHGSDGQINLGASWLNSTTLQQNSEAVAGWGKALTETGDILFYGCDLTATEIGQNLTKTLADLTGADVAASNDTTGHTIYGGDWDLEYSSGTIETKIAVNETEQQEWQNLLATVTVADDFSSGDFTGSTGSQAWSGDWSTSGGVVITGGEMRINLVNSTATRQVDLSTAVTASLSFDFHTGTGVEAGDPDSIVIEVSNNGGTDWAILEDINYYDGVNSGSKTYDINSHATATTQIRFRVNNGYGGPDEFFYVDNVQITYSDTNSTPVITSNGSGDTASINVVENQTTVTTVTATDADLEPLTFSISGGADASQFDLVGGVLTFKTAPDFEAPTDADADNIYQVTVQVTDDNGGFDTQAISVTVTDINDAPVDLRAIATADGGTVMNADGGNDLYFVADDGDDLLGGLTSVTIEASFSANTPPPGHDLTPLLSYADGANDEELALFIKSDGRLWFGAHSNGTIIQSTTGSYMQLFDGKVHSVAVSWDSSNGATAFYVDGQLVESFTGYQTGETITGNGELVFGQDQDSELGGFKTFDVFSGALYDVRIFNDVRTATEISAGYNHVLPNTEPGMIANWLFNGLSAGGVITDTVSGNNLTEQHVVDTGFSTSVPQINFRVRDDAVDGTVVGSVSAVDPDSGETFTYSLVDDAGGRFAINSSNGEITVADTSLLDASVADSHIITVRVTDSGALTYDETFEVSVFDINYSPVAIGESYLAVEGIPYTSGLGVDDLLLNDTDIDGDTLSVNTTPVSAPANGELILNADGTFTYTPNDNFNGTDSFVYQVLDGNGGIAQATVTITVQQREIRILFTTQSDVNSSKVPGIVSWDAGDVLGIGDPNLSFEPVGSDGSILPFFDLEGFADSSDMTINGLHFVSNDLTVGSDNSIDLQRGDILFVSASDDVMTSTNSLAITGGDVIVFRPDVAEDYTAGTFIHLLDQPGTNITTGITLIETDVLVGDITLTAGSFLFTQENIVEESSIYHHSAADVGAGTTDGVISTLISSVDIGVNWNNFVGVMVVNEDLYLDGTMVPAGSIVTTLANGDDSVGNNGIFADEDNIIYLTVTSTTMGSGTTAADATLLFDAGDVGLNNNQKKIRSFSIIEEISAIVNVDPVITLSAGTISYTEGDPWTLIDPAAVLVDPDSADFDGGLLSVDFGTTGFPTDQLAIRDEGTLAGQIGASGNVVTYGGTDIGTYSGGSNGSEPLTVIFNVNADVTAIQALLRNITFINTSNNPTEAQRSANFTITDGDGGVSNTATRAIVVNNVNFAPVLTGSNDLTAIDEDLFNSGGTLVSILISGWVADADLGSVEGIAVTNVDNTNGSWEFSIDGGTSWTAFGSPDANNARHIAANPDSFIRFVPNPDWNGTVTNGITFHAWDQTSGVNGDIIDLTNSNNLRDQFDTVSLSNNDGSAVWTSDWTEDNDDDSAATGNIRVEGGKLRLDNLDGGDKESIVRSFDLSGAASAVLTFDYDGFGEGGLDVVEFEVSNDGGSSWETLESVDVVGNVAGSKSYNLENYTLLTADMQLRFSIVKGMAATTQHINFDNVDIAYSGTGVGGDTSVSVASASSSITVNPVNDAPTVANPIADVTVNQDDPPTIIDISAVFADVDIATNSDSLTYTVVSSDNSLVTASLSGTSLTLTYAAGQSGSATVTVTATDADGPLAVDDVFNVTVFNNTPTVESTIADQGLSEDFTSYTIDLKTAFADVETADVDLVYGVSGNTNINVSISGGIATITTTADWHGNETLTFTATDAGGLSISQDVAFAVAAVADITDDTAVAVVEDTPTIIAVLTNDTFEGTPVVTATSVPVNGGSVTINADNTITYTPALNYNGPDSFTYTVTSGGVTETATVTVTVSPVNDNPTVESTMADQSLSEDFASYTIDLNAAFADVETADVDLVYGVSGNTNINVSISGGIATITTTADWHGNETLTFTATDAGGLSISQDVAFAVAAVADINDDTAVAVVEDTPTIIAVLTNDTFEGTPVVTATSVPVNGGSVTINADNTITYTPALNYNGPDSFTYTVTSGGVTETATVTVTVSPVNDNPTVESTMADQSLSEDFASYTIDLNAAFADVETADVDLVYGVSGNTNINVSISGGIATITTTADWHGNETLTFTATDAGGLSISQDVAFAVAAVADITDDTAVAVVEDTPTIIAVLTNDTFEGTPVVTATSVPVNGGSVTINADNTITYTPALNYNGPDSFTYTVTSGGVTETATVTVTVSPVNDNPTVESTMADQSLSEDFASYTIDLNAAFADVETADVDLVYGVSGNTNINVSIAGGIATITTTADWHGNETLTFTATDAGGLSISQDVAFAVAAVADINDDTAVAVVEDTPTIIAVLTNDTFEGTPVVTATSVPVNGGSVTINADNTITYTPALNYNGPDSFTYTVTSGGVTETATVTVTVSPVNDNPTVESTMADQSLSEDFASYTIDLNAAFADVETADVDLVYGVSGNTNINVSIAGGIATITTTADWHGNETLTFTATDAGGLSISQDVAFAVAAVADINDDTAVAVVEDTPTIIAVLTNDTFEGTPVVTATSVPVNGGSVTINADNTITYTPALNYNGPDSFTYTVTSGGVTETATVTVTVSPVNDNPTVESTMADQSLSEDFASYTIDLNAAFADVETADVDLVYGVSGNTNINVSIAGGIATITTTADWHGNETLTFTATDAGGLSISQDVAFAVAAVADITDDTAVAVVEDTPTIIAVLTNDTFEGTPVVTATSVPVNGGSVTINADNTITYTPALNYNGPDSFTYTVTSGGVTETATVTVTVSPVNDNPTVESTMADQSLSEDFASYTIDLNAAFADVETADVDLVYGVSGNTNINVSIAGGIATITTTADWHGNETLTFTATDAGGLSISQDVAFAVAAVADINDDTAVAVVEDTPTIIAVLTNDTFEGTPVVTATSVPVNGGSVTINADNTITYTPALNYNGPDSFTYTVTSGGVTETATVTVTVSPVNDNPTVESTMADQSLSEDFASYTIDLNAAFADVETADVDLVYGVSGNTNINVSIAGGIATITTTADWHGNETLTFTATDAGGLSISQDVAFAVAAVADINDDTAVAVVEDTPTIIAVLTNDTFEGTPVVTATSVPVNGGSVTINADNTITYTPALNYNGPDSFTYTVASGGVTETATVTVTVSPVNDNPTVESTMADQSLSEDFASYTIDLNAAFADVETADVDLVYGVSGNTNINVSIAGGIATITTTADWHGNETLTFTATDAGGLSISQDVAFAVAAVADINDDTAVAVVEDTPTIIAVLTNDTFEGTPVVTATSVPVNGGSVTINADNTITYTPALNYNGPDSFTYTVTSGGVTETATVTVNVSPVNDNPTVESTIADQSLSEDFASYTIDLNAAFADVETADVDLVYGVSGNTNINVSISGGIATITTTADWHGNETLTFTATDAGGLSISQDVAFAVAAVADINDDTAVAVVEDTPTIIAVLTNDTFEGTPVVTATSVPVNGGSVTINADNTITYTPALNYNGPDSFTYTVTSGGVTETATVTVTVSPVNDNPTVESTMADQSLSEDFASYTIDLNAAFADVETADVDLVYGVSGNTNINVSIAGGIATITTTADWHGNETLTFTATDAGGLSISQDVAFAVAAVADINDDTAVAVVEDTPTIIAVLTNDTFEGTPVVTATSVPVNGGSVTINADNTITYTPALNYNGPDSFTYTVTSGGVTETATVTVTVSPVNDNPTVESTIADQSLSEDFASYTIDLNAAFDDVETADVDLVYGVSGNTNINVSIAGGIATITTTADWHGNETLTFTATDAGGLSISQDVAFAVAAVADINDDTAVAVVEDTPTIIAVLTNDTFEGTPVVTATSVPVNGGSVTINADNTITYTPALNYNGPDSFTYTVTSGGVTETATVTVTVSPVNDNPTVESTMADQSLSEDFASYTIDLNAAFADVETADVDLVYGVSGNTNINVSIAGGIATITTTADWHGNETLTFTATDAGGLSISQDVAFAVAAVADITDDTAVAVVEDTPTIIAVLTNDTFEGTPVVTATSVPVNGGSVTINADNTITYTPALNYNGPDSFTYTVTSGGVTETATVTVTVSPVNDNPTVESTMADQSLSEDFASYTIDLNAAFADVETADVDLVYGVSGNTNINVSIAGGIATITTTADWHGNETLTFTATDAGGLSISQDVAFAVAAVADITDDTAVAVVEDTPTIIAVLTNDTFEGTPVVTATSVPVNGGSVTINADNTITYTPALNYNGPDSFTYTVASGGVTETATVTVTVSPVNDNPTVESTIADQSLSEDFASYTIDLNAAFADVETADVDLVYGVSGNTNINVSIAGGIATITTTADWHGNETLTFTATDAGGLSISQDVAFAVAAVADITDDTAVAVVEDTPTIIAVLTNDTFEGTPVVTATSVPVNGGSVTINADNTITYTPALNYNGPDSFTYTVTSGGVTETATVTVNVSPVNDNPTVESTMADQSLSEDFASYTIDLNAAFADVETADVDLVYGVSGNTNINVSIAGGIATITTTADWHGNETLTFTATDAGGLSISQDVAFAVAAVADINDDTAVAVVEDTPTIIAVLTNDTFEGTPVVTATSVPVNGGSVTINADNTITYTPALNYNGPDSFTYTVTSGGVTETATVTVNVSPVNDNPTVESTMADQSLSEDFASYTIDLNAAFADVETADVDLVYGVSGNTNINVSIAGGIATISTTADWHGNETLTFTATDAGGLSISQDVAFAVAAVADITDDTAVAVVEDTPTIIAVLTNDTFEGTPVVTATSVPVNGGSVTINADNTITYTPALNYNGPDSFTYTVTSGGVTETATVTVTVSPVNDPTIITGGTSGSGDEDTTITGTLTATDNDGLADGSVFAVTGAAANGLATIDAGTGAWSYTPNADYNGNDSFTVTITDDADNTTTQVISLSVAAIADIADDTDTTNEDTAVTTNVLTNDSFEGTPVITAITQGANGSVAIVDANAGTISYTPNANFNGTDSYTYTVTSGGVTETATVTVTVDPVNDPTIITGGTSGSGDEDTTITGTLTATDNDGLADGSVFAVTGAAANGSATIDAGTGAWSYTPNADYNGNDSFTVTITDDADNTTTQVISLSVAAIADEENLPDNNGETPTDPEPDTGNEIATDTSPDEDLPGNEVTEATLHPIKSYPTDNVPLMNDQGGSEPTNDILYLTDEDDTESETLRNRDDLIYYDNDLYKEISAAKHLNFTYKLPELNDIPDDFSNIDFENDTLKQIVANGDYDQFRKDIDDAFSAEQYSDSMKANLITLTTTTFTIGFVSYLLRAGVLLASLISTLPIWHGFDPIVVFARKKKKRDQNDVDESDEPTVDTFFNGKSE